MSFFTQLNFLSTKEKMWTRFKNADRHTIHPHLKITKFAAFTINSECIAQRLRCDIVGAQFATYTTCGMMAC